MSLRSGICHNLLISGNLLRTEGQLTLKIVHDDLKKNLWQICFHELCVNFQEPLNVICGLSTNFVKDITFDKKSHEIKTIFPVLKLQVLKGATSDKKIYRFEQSWFYINHYQDELVVNFINLENTDKLISSNCDVWLTILIQRVS